MIPIKKVVFLALFSLVHCSTSPTGRKQLILMPAAQLDQMGVQSFDELKAKTPIEKGEAINAFVRCVAAPITKAAEGQTDVKSWEVVVFRDNQVNAFALPGGKIGVYTGILKVTKSEGQLAAIMGHEVGHVIAHHGNERVSQGIGAGVVQSAASLALSGNSTQRNLILGSLGLGMQFGVMLPFSRTHESEADLIGIRLMAKAGFDPAQSVELWKNMAAAGGGAPPEWMSTHPSNQRRIDDLSSHVPEVRGDYEAAKQSGKAPSCGAVPGV